MGKLRGGGGSSSTEERKCNQKDGIAATSAAQPVKSSDLGQINNVIGDFGKYQFLIFVFKILIGATSAFNNLGVTFFAPSDFISFWCADGVTQSSLTTNQGLTPDPSPSILSNQTLPMPRTSTTQIQQVFSEFLINSERNRRHNVGFDYDTPKNVRKECKYLSKLDNQYHKCTSFRYDTGIWISTIIDEWDLVCDRSWLISVTQSLYMGGFILSFLMFGYISDRFGRWRSLMLGALIEILSGFGCALSGSVFSFMIFRFLLGLGNAGRSSSSYLIMIEWVGPKWRLHISTLGSLGWVVGYCAMPWLTLFFLHFRHMQLFVCFYELILVIWLLRIPESPRWLLTHKRFDEAHKVLLGAARFNGLVRRGDENCRSDAYDLSTTNQEALARTKQTDLESKGAPPNKQEHVPHSRPSSVDEFNVKFGHLVDSINSKEFSKNEDRLSILDLFRWSNLRRYALILFFVWAADSFIYYGIALRVGDFGGKNLFITFTIAGLTEMPSMVFTIICMKFLPRKTTNLFILVTTGLLCASQVPLKYYEFYGLQQSTILLAKLFNSCLFTCILYQTMELFPTSIRQTAYSSCSLAGRIGSILAPFIKELAQITNDSVPPIIYATLSFMAAFLIQDLPETKGIDLPDTLLEAEKFKGKEGESFALGCLRHKATAKHGKSAVNDGRVLSG